MAQKPKQNTRNRKSRQQRGRKNGVMVFTKKNYSLLIIGLVMIVVGYVIMRMENEVDGVISLYVAPLLLLAGYLEIIYAIMWRPKAEAAQAEKSALAKASWLNRTIGTFAVFGQNRLTLAPRPLQNPEQTIPSSVPILFHEIRIALPSNFH